MLRWIVVPMLVIAFLASTVTAEAYQRHPKLWAWYRASGAKCVHQAEGSWTDPGAPYWGGFQMGLWFQERFAPRLLAAKGTADHWKPFRQVIVVRRVVRQFGWSQWSTAALCGL